jgi:L-ascorbate metabolism protein UlaG (beta-lactamase superfamily)
MGRIDAAGRHGGFRRRVRSHSRRGRPARIMASTLCASAMFLILSCAAPPAQNQNAAAPTATTPQVTANTTPEQATSVDGDIRVTAITHASFELEYGAKVIHIDPTSPGDYSKAKQADLILITDIHPDHLDPAAIAKVRKPGAPVVAPSAAAEKIESPTVIANGETKTVAGIPIKAVPMYNLKRGPAPGQLFHPKGRGNGYILTLGSKRVYVAGDTECTDEMRALKNIDIAFVPMNLPYTMPPSEAAECVKAFRPKVVYPYHYRGQNPEEFKAALKGEPIEVRLLDWYPPKPAGAPGQ